MHDDRKNESINNTSIVNEVQNTGMNKENVNVDKVENMKETVVRLFFH